MPSGSLEVIYWRAVSTSKFKYIIWSKVAIGRKVVGQFTRIRRQRANRRLKNRLKIIREEWQILKDCLILSLRTE